MASGRVKCLIAFDFDNTIIAENSDKTAIDMIEQKAFPTHLIEILQTQGWNKYMSAVFAYLYERQVRPEHLLSRISNIAEVDGMIRCIELMRHYNMDVIIISDSNSVFIDTWLKKHGIRDLINNIYTNPAWFTDAGQLCIEPYHHQTECQLSEPNLCKTKVLEAHVARAKADHGIEYAKIFYVGDGTNDICPNIKLSDKDYGCLRKGFAADKKITKLTATHAIRIQATLIRWTSGNDLCNQIEAILSVYNN